MNHWGLETAYLKQSFLFTEGDCLLLREEGAAATRRRVLSGESYKPMLESIRREAARISELEPPGLPYSLYKLYGEQGTRLEYERPYFERRRRLNTYALLAWLEPGHEAWAERLADEIWLICDEYTWSLPAHVREHGALTVDLFAAETAFALAEIEALVGPNLPDAVRERLRGEVRRRIFDPFLQLGPWHWETWTHNWSAVCAGSVGAAAIYLMDDREELAAVTERVLSAVACFLNGYGEDGACLEGFGYWTYGFGFFVYYADLLRRKTGGTVDLFDLLKIRAIAGFPGVCFLNGASVANFSDAHPQYLMQPGLMYGLAKEFAELSVPGSDLFADYTDDHCSRWAHALRDLVWTPPSVEAETIWPAGSNYLPNAEWLVSRHRTEGGSYAFVVKAGHNAEPHNHNDLGHFMLYADGAGLLIDLGCGMYTADYFGDKRYEFACNGSQGHSVPIVNGVFQMEGASRVAKVLRVELGSSGGAAGGGFTAAGAAGGKASNPTEATSGGTVSAAGKAASVAAGGTGEAYSAGEVSAAAGAGEVPDGSAVNTARGGGVDVLELELAGAYPVDGLSSLIRRFEWVKQEWPVLRLTDTYEFAEAPTSYVERLISPLRPEQVGEGELLIGGLGGVRDSRESGELVGPSGLRLLYDAEILTLSVRETSFMDHFARETVYYELDFAVKHPEARGVVRFEMAMI